MRDAISELSRDRIDRHSDILPPAIGRTSLFHRIERSFDRRFLLREPFRASRAWVDYYLVESSTVPEVYVGRSGWLYYRDELDDYRKAACSQAGEMEAMALRLQEVERIVVASGRNFVFMVAPNKSTIYPEHVGLSQSVMCSKSRYDLLLEALQKHPLDNFVRLDDLLMTAKDEKQVYFKMDTHWNDEGVLIVVRALLRHIQPQGHGKILSNAQVTSQRWRGDLTYMLGLHVHEVSPYVVVANDGVVRREEPSTPESRVRHLRTVRAAIDHEPLLPPVVIYGDSFMENPLRLIETVFSRVDAYWRQGAIDSEGIRIPMGGSERALLASQTVIFETVERHLPYLRIEPERFREVFDIPQSDLEERTP